MYRKLVSLVGSGLILVSVFMSLFAAVRPMQASATSTEPQDEQRRLLVAFKYCLSDQKIDESDNGNPAEDFADMWDGGIDGYKKEDVVVGFELEGDNGVKSCETSILPGLKILEPQITTPGAAETRLFALLANSDGKVFRANRDKLVARIDDQIKSMGSDPRKAFTANRLSPLITLCYDIKIDKPSYEATNQNFRAKFLGTQYFFEHKSDADDDSYKWLKQGAIGENVFLGDIKLGFESSKNAIGKGDWDSFESDFYPFGSDLQSFTSGHAGNNGILDCKFIKEKMESGFFTDDVISSVDIDKDIVIIGVDTNGDGKADVALDPVTVASVDAGGDTHVDCQTGGLSLNPFTLADNAISWLLCPLLDGAQAIVNTVGGWVVDQLEFDVDQYLVGPTTDKNDAEIFPVKDAWNAFRVISLSLVILVALAGILMGSFIDAYTIKKILPRMLIAIIAISLSWDLLVLVIRITNSLGIAVRSMIDLPFNSLNNAAINPLVILGGAGAATGLTTILGALSLIGTAALAVLFAFIFTILRVGAIIALVIFAPIAILCWILPGTQKGWNFWQEGLMGALLMFPIVTAFLSIGSAFGKIIYNIEPNSPLNQTIALIATYAPYFLIPKAFSMAGGIVGNLSGQLNDRGRGAFDRLKKFRQDQGQKRWGDIKGGRYFHGGNKDSFRRRVSGIAQGASLLPNAGLGRDTSKWKGKLDDARSVASQTYASKATQDDAAKLARDKDDAIMRAFIESGGDLDEAEKVLVSSQGTADLYGGGKKADGTLWEEGTEAYKQNWEANRGARESALRGIEALKKDYGADTAKLIAARTLFRSSTAFSYENGFGEMAEIIRKVATKSDGTVDTLLATQLLEEGNAAQNAAGRNDVGGASFSVGIKAINNVGRQKINADGTLSTEIYTSQDATHDAWESAFGGKPPDEVFRGGKKKNGQAVSGYLYGYTDGAGNHHKGEVEIRMEKLQADTSLTEEQRAQEATRILQWEESYHVAASRSSADIREVMGASFGEKFDHDLLPPEMREKIFTKQVPVLRNGVPVMKQDPTKPKGFMIPETTTQYDPDLELTRVEVFDKLRGTKEWQLYAKEYGYAAAAAGANVAVAGIEPPPVDPGATGAGGGAP